MKQFQTKIHMKGRLIFSKGRSILYNYTIRIIITTFPGFILKTNITIKLITYYNRSILWLQKHPLLECYII